MAKRAAKPQVGMIGLGVMGSAMAANLMRAGYGVVGYDVRPFCRRRHARTGGTVAPDAHAVFAKARIVITSLPSVKALEATAASCGRGSVVVETSTFPIADKQRIRRLLAAKGSVLLDCPLSGTGAQAKTGDLVVFGSGERAAWRRVLPVLKGFSRSQYHLGPFGNGSKMKFVANLLVAIHNVSAAEALVLARKSGLNAALSLKVLGDGAGSSRMLQVRGPMMVKRAYRPATMSIGLWRKDMKIIGEFARALQSATPLFAATKAVYNAAMAQGLARADTASVHKVLEGNKGRKK